MIVLAARAVGQDVSGLEAKLVAQLQRGAMGVEGLGRELGVDVTALAGFLQIVDHRGARHQEPIGYFALVESVMVVKPCGFDDDILAADLFGRAPGRVLRHFDPSPIYTFDNSE
jgi:hypothetical protein